VSRAGSGGLRGAGDLAFTLALAAFFAWAAYEARVWPDNARLFPIAVAVPALGLAVLQVVLALRTPAAAHPPDRRSEVDALPAGERARRTLEIAAWIIGIFAAVYLIGFVLAVPLAALAYLRLTGREGWPASLLVAALCWGLVYGVFDRVLHVPLPAGPLLTVLGLG
jgi:hypothetical protein